MKNKNTEKIAAIVVTYNRKKLLNECLSSLVKQNRSLDSIIVMDNASTDGTGKMLKENYLDNPVFDYVKLKENIGGAGGFHCGVKRAHEKGFDWVWCMDDDTITQKDSLKELIKTSDIARDSNKKIGFICSSVRWIDNNQCQMNRPRLKYESWLNNSENNVLEIISSSFVSVLISSEAITQMGLPLKKMFIWGEDIEYTTRISSNNSFSNYIALKSLVVHKTKNNKGLSAKYLHEKDLWKLKYFFRNRIYTTLKHDTNQEVFLSLVFIAKNLFDLLIRLRLIIFIQSIYSLFIGLTWLFTTKPSETTLTQE